MKMKEICERSGLTERAVRLYCERGLVHPEKYSERGREYLVFSDHNLRELAIISELRRADFSLVNSMICITLSNLLFIMSPPGRSCIFLRNTIKTS